METYLLRKSIHRLPGKVIHRVPLPDPKVTEGHGIRSEIGAICQEYGYKHVLLVTDVTLNKLGYADAIMSSLSSCGVSCLLYADIRSEPTIGIIDGGRTAAQRCGADCVIALGGGSVMDSCKMIAAGVRMPHVPTKGLLLKFLPVPGKTLPLIMVPSTAGTGAEVTVGAVVTNSHGVKSSTVVIGLDVRHVVLDSELTERAPRSVTVACGIDALSHCIEGVLSDTDASEEDMRKSLEGVRLILSNLPKVLSSPEDVEARLSLCRAAMYGGNAINTQLAGYVHAFAHSIGAKYHMSHGEAISLMLLPVLEYISESCKADYSRMASYCGVEDLLAELRSLLALCGLDQLRSPVRRADHNELIRMVALDSINYSSPVTLSNGDIRHILEQITEEK